MRPEGRGRVVLLFGVPESGRDAVARIGCAHGLDLAGDAADVTGQVGVSTTLEAFAARMNALAGLTADAPGPVMLPNRSLAATRRLIHRKLEPHLDEAAAAIATVLPDGAAASVLITAGSMALLPQFWLTAFERCGRDIRPVLLHRNPVAIARQVRAAGGHLPRQTIFQWHHQALDLLSAAPEKVEVLVGPDLDTSVLGVRVAQLPALPPLVKEDADLSTSPIVSEQTQALDELLRRWATIGRRIRVEAAGDLRRRFDEAVTLTGTARLLTSTVPASGSEEAEPSTPPAPVGPVAATHRPLVFHYHVFKNAGTSVDAMLKSNFGDRWMESEFSAPPHQRRDQVREFLQENAQLEAFSSHTALLPVPDLPDRYVFPIIFIRHPLLRLKSAYSFEYNQNAETKGSILARSTDFRGYIETLLGDPASRQVRNFQTYRFAAGTPGAGQQELDRGLATLATLPFVGLVEAYDESIDRLAKALRPLFPDFEPVIAHENATGERGRIAIEDRLAEVRGQLGGDLYDRLEQQNAHDLALFERVRATYSVKN